ncbi:MAG: hypothetical protein A2X78_03320 [Gammaproteobacteria bacterium GWE2_37_16]|nr:MAG: hypothetical protein A2X78_03320 [Gammaproteobacteria bacterium GWE2_37_16]
MKNPLTSILENSKKTLRLATPYVSARVLNAANWFVSMAIIAHLGKEAVAAGVLMYSTVVTLQVVVWSMLYSVSVVVGRAYGAGEVSGIGRVVQAGCVLALLIGLPTSILLWHVDYILLLLKQPTALVALAKPYFHIMAFSILPSLFYVCFYKFSIGVLRSRLVFIAMAIAVPVNLFLTYVLTLGKFGFPSFGIVGVAYANLTMYCGLCFGLFLYFCWGKEFKVFNLFKFGGNKNIKQLFCIGWPISIEWGAMMLTYTFSTYMIGWIGVSALAAHQVVTQCVNLVIMVPYSLAHITAVLVAQRIGAKQREFIEKIGYAGVLVSLLVVGLASLFYWIAPKTLIAVYLNVHDITNLPIIALAISLLIIMGITQISDTVGAVMTGALRGFHDTVRPMLISMTTNWLISLPLGYFLAFVWHQGAVGVYWGCLFGSIISSILLLRRWQAISQEEKLII